MRHPLGGQGGDTLPVVGRCLGGPLTTRPPRLPGRLGTAVIGERWVGFLDSPSLSQTLFCNLLISQAKIRRLSCQAAPRESQLKAV